MPEYICDVCEINFASQRELDEHMKKQHAGETENRGAEKPGKRQ
ncbi:MAG: C2H2-type zinc finger protein [Candidatus Micrarchaeota archaeon]|nr:C2H2-type zinc finger protein [Candidatus Micrarchaeota archaeon]